MTSEKIKGLVAATVTPMKANGEVNLPALDSYVKHLEKQGLAGVFVNGTTGADGQLYFNPGARDC